MYGLYTLGISYQCI